MSAELRPDIADLKLQIVDRALATSHTQLYRFDPNSDQNGNEGNEGRVTLPPSAVVFVGESCPVDFCFPREEIVDLRKKLLARTMPKVSIEESEEDLSQYTSPREDAPPPHLVKQMTDIYLSGYKVFIDRVARTGVTYERADDLVNDMYIKGYRGLKTYKNQGTMGAWMSRIITNLAIDAARRRQRFWMIDGEDGENHMRGIGDDGMSHDERVLQNEKRAIFYESLDRLSPRDRKALKLVYFEGFSCEDAGKILGLTGSATKSVLFRAREQLRNDPNLAELMDRN